MAAIDKIYGTLGQYDELHAWCAKNLEGALQYFYPRDDYDDSTTRPISNFPQEIDAQLLLLCPITWVAARIKDQYGIEDRWAKAWKKAAKKWRRDALDWQEMAIKELVARATREAYEGMKAARKELEAE